ncbi:MAG TPA: class I SAM-dependent methyltransferase [Planctomycetota bacterium]
MDFEKLKQSWQHLGATDPRWAILTEPGREGGKWDDASFWRSGEDFVDWVAQHLMGLGALPVRGRALDFGCGHGRLTQALAKHFADVVGVDIAASMIEVARAANRHGARVNYVLNERPDLSVLPDNSFDFVLTVLVLQHMRPDYSAGYLREFLRVLRPGGLMFFQIPVDALAPAAGAVAGRAPSEAVSAPDLKVFTTVLPPLLFLPADEWHWLRISLYNAGAHSLRASGAGSVEIGMRFVRDNGTVGTQSVWTALPHDIAPGVNTSLLVPVRMPSAPGNYELMALPCAGRTWFAHPENVPAVGHVVVSPVAPGRVVAPEPPPVPVRMLAPPPGDPHLIEVYGTKRGDLYENIRANGGEFVDVSLDAWAGYEWISAHCVVRKR